MSTNPRRSQRLVELNKKKRKLSVDGKEIEKKKAKEDKQAIWIASEVLLEIVGWVQLHELPNVNMVSRRYWRVCDEILEGKNHTIRKLIIGTQPCQLKVEKAVKGTSKIERAPFAEVEPPQNFKLSFISLPRSIGRKAIRFLKLSKQLFADVELDYGLPATHNIIDIFENCSKINIMNADAKYSKEFFARAAITNCNNIEFSELDHAFNFSLNSTIDWLHAPPAVDSSAKRQLCFDIISNIRTTTIVTYINRIVKRFMKDVVAQKFAILFHFNGQRDPTVLETIRLANPRTAEVWYSNSYGDCCEYIRCSNEDEGKDSAEYEFINMEDSDDEEGDE